MARKRLTKAEKLINFARKQGDLTHKQIVQFLLRGTGHKYDATTRKYYDPMLYGRNGYRGLLETDFSQNPDGTYTVLQ